MSKERDKKVEEMAEIINESFGVDAAYFGVDPWGLADQLLTYGITIRKKGEWVLLDNCSNEGWYCSLCHKKVYRADASYANVILPSKRCPNCGADMREKGQKDE